MTTAQLAVPDPLDYPCPTCKADPGQPCDKRGNRRLGGPNHLTRVDRFIRAERTAR